jgi:hypothetical protein
MRMGAAANIAHLCHLISFVDVELCKSLRGAGTLDRVKSTLTSPHVHYSINSHVHMG